jgi:hypothetical protein
MIRPDLTDRGFLMWAAAWIDTEGSIGLYHKRRDNPACFGYAPTVMISQVVLAPLEILKCTFGGSFAYDGRTTSLRISNHRAITMLQYTRPYLVVKGAQADLLLLAGSIKARRRFMTPTDAAELEAIKQQLHVLNNSKPEDRQRQSEAAKRYLDRKRHVRLLQTV